MESLRNWFDFGKIRASWGMSGMHFYQNYLALGIMAVDNSSYLGNPVITPVWNDGLYNQDLSWEKTSQYDFGLDLNFLNYRLGATLDYYYRYTEDLLMPVPLPGNYNGFQNQWRNTAAISNEGIELMVEYKFLTVQTFCGACQLTERRIGIVLRNHTTAMIWITRLSVSLLTRYMC